MQSIRRGGEHWLRGGGASAPEPSFSSPGVPFSATTSSSRGDLIFLFKWRKIISSLSSWDRRSGSPSEQPYIKVGKLILYKLREENVLDLPEIDVKAAVYAPSVLAFWIHSWEMSPAKCVTSLGSWSLQRRCLFTKGVHACSACEQWGGDRKVILAHLVHGKRSWFWSLSVSETDAWRDENSKQTQINKNKALRTNTMLAKHATYLHISTCISIHVSSASENWGPWSLKWREIKPTQF